MILPTTDQVYIHSLSNQHQEIYYWGVEKDSRHSIQVGDLVIINDKVAQIIVIYKDLNRATKTNQMKAYVRWMMKFKQAQKVYDLKALKDKFRPENALIETDQLETIEIQNIDPAQVVLHPSSYYSTHDPEPIQDHGSYWTAYFHCPYYVAQGKPKKCFNDWPISTLKPLQRAWNTILQQQPHLKSLIDEYEKCVQVRPRSIIRAATQKATPDLQENQPPKESKKRAPPQPVSKKKATKKRKMVIETPPDTPDVSMKSKEPFDVRPKPLGEPVAKSNSRHEGKKDASVKSFHTSVEIDSRKGRRWTVDVGDLVAVSVPESHKIVINGKLWYPFGEPWSPGQIIAIYESEGKWFVQVRWLYVPHELEDDVLGRLSDDLNRELFESSLSKRMLVERDEHCTQLPVDTLLGRLSITSNPKPKKAGLQRFVSPDGVPSLLMICKYGHQSKSDSFLLHRVDDWDRYETKVDGPLSRGLYCERGYPAKNTRLEKKYASFLRKKYNLQESLKQPVESFPTIELEDDRQDWDSEQFDLPIFEGRVEAQLLGSFQFDGASLRLFSSIEVPVSASRCDSRAISKKNVENRSFCVRVGDIVCISDNDAGSIDHSVKEAIMQHRRTQWYPFPGKWSYVQVLSIYSKDGDKDKQMFVEVRSIKRFSELTQSSRKGFVVEGKGEIEELVESDATQRNVSAGRILGRALVRLGHHIDACNPCEDEEDIPISQCRIRYSLVTQFDHLQPLFCALLTPKEWFRRMVERGVKLSKYVQANDSYRETLMFDTDLDLDGTEGMSKFGIFSGLVDDSKETDFVSCEVSFETSEKDTDQLVSIKVVPLWNCIAENHLFCHQADRNGLMWNATVGDCVAVKHRGEELDDCFPFTVPWRVLQICWIRKVGPDYEIGGRWFATTKEVVRSGDKVYESDRMTELSQQDLLGPVELVADDNETMSKGSGFMPRVRVVYAGTVKFDRSQNPEYSDSKHTVAVRELWKRSILDFNCKIDAKEREELYFQMRSHRRRNDFSNLSSTIDEDIEMEILFSPTSSTKSPGVSNRRGIHSPKSQEAIARRSSETICSCDQFDYFSSISVTPSTDNFLVKLDESSSLKDVLWTVKIGDPIILRYQQCIGPANYVAASDFSGNKSFPFRHGWGVAEVVMFRVKKDMEEPAEIEMEVRWFYRAGEIPGSFDKVSHEADECEEIYESDLYTEESAHSILAPALLHPAPCKITRNRQMLGMPLVEFVSRSFWSATQKAMIPCGGGESRVARGRARSQWMGNLPVLKNALSENRRSDVIIDPSPLNWRAAFDRVLAKLSLTNASEEAVFDSAAIVGREKERGTIASFLKTAISGKEQDVSQRPVLFIAGPPGTGKTACVRATVSELQKDGSECADFKFIAINGMELRNPNDAYIVLWEKLSGQKTSCKAKRASENIDAYFKERKGNAKETENTIVLLFDEIDYLVSKKMNVLYHLFQLPQSSQSDPHLKNRIVLIGISNTLDLPERIHSRTQSRVGEKRCMFKSYCDDEIKEILISKITPISGGFSFFDTDALSYAAKRTANSSGDIRRALKMCKQAAENKARQVGNTPTDIPRVRVKDILDVCSVSFDSAEARGISYCSSLQILLLVSLATLRRTTGREFGGFDIEDILTKMKAISMSLGDPRYSPSPSFNETLDMLARLSEMHLVRISTGNEVCESSSSYGGLFLPTVDPLFDDIAVLIALKKTDHKKIGEEYLSRASFEHQG